MAKATRAFHAWDSEESRTVTYEPGDEVPDHVARTVGEHVLDKPVEGDDDGVDASAFDGAAFDAAVQAKVDEELEGVRREVADEQRNREEAAYSADGYGTFDPTQEKAKAVKEYLSGLDVDTVAGAREYRRVVDAEQAGENRSTALPDGS